MYLFFDTEFTDFKNMNLISIGIISEDGQHQFYREISDYNSSYCTDFVKTTVLPLLDGSGIPINAVAKQLASWLKALPDDKFVFVYDYLGDWLLLQDLFYISCPTVQCDKQFFDDAFREAGLDQGIRTYDAICDAIDKRQEAHCEYFEQDPRQHHSLVDACALRQGWIQGLLT